MIKKLLLLVVLGLVLTGCKSDHYDNAYALLSTNERLLLDLYVSDYRSDGYDKTLLAVLFNRHLTSPDDNNYDESLLVENQKAPFCDVLTTLEAEETPSRASVVEGESILTRWEDIRGKTLRESCGLVEEKVAPIDDNAFEIEYEEGTFDDPDKYISKQDYKDLGETVGECNIAKVKLISLMGLGLITEDQKEEITMLTLQCEHDKLRQTLNQ